MHSPTSSVDEAARFLRESNADAVVAVGGGSVIVTARAASTVLAECRSVPEMCTYRAADGRFISPKLPEPKLPQFVLPTTPTSACVKAGSAVLDEETGRRMALFDPKTRARAIFLHPTLLQTPSVELVMSSALNTLAMSVEGLESATSDPISDALLTHSLRILTEQLPRLQEKAMAPADREKLMFAAVLCGRGTDVAGGGLASVIGHTLGQRTQVANGYVNAIVLPWTMQYNAPATSEGRLTLIADALRVAPSLGHETAPSAIGRVQALLDGLLIPRRLKDIGLLREELPQIAAAAMDDFFVDRNPQPVRSAADVLTVLQAAW